MKMTHSSWGRVSRKPYNRVGITLIIFFMSTKKLFTFLGAVALTISGAIAGRASMRPNTVTKLYYTKGVPGCIVLCGSVSCTPFTTSGASETQATIVTSNGVNAWRLYATSNCGATHRIHFRG
jgi:hypothetical protein